MFTKRHEQELAEIKALSQALDRSAQEALEQFERIRGAQDHGRATPSGDGAGAVPLLAFVHIPKTAGGTVSAMFQRGYSKAALHSAGNYVSSPENTEKKVAKPAGGWERWHRRGGRVSVGHVPYGVFRKHLPPDTCYMTFLRDPVDRVVSHYYRHVHRPGMSDAERATRPGKRARSLEEALVEMRLPQLCNLCTRFLCSRPTLGELPPSSIDEAKENLRTFTFVGIQERFEESIVLLQRTFRLGLVPYLDRHVSRAGGRPSVDEISDHELALIKEHNQLDAELYAFGLELFQEAIDANDGELAAEVERLRSAAEAAREEHQEAVHAARAWLHRELPAGATEPVGSVIARAEAAGFTRATINEVRLDLLVTKEKDPDATWSFRRANGASLTALEDAKVWLERELPRGASEVLPTLIERGEAAGHSREALNRARKVLAAIKIRGADGQWVWSRP